MNEMLLYYGNRGLILKGQEIKYMNSIIPIHKNRSHH